MDAIVYQENLEGIDWNALKTTLVADDFDNGRTPEQLRRSFANSYAVCFAIAGGKVVGKARALSDGVCNAYIVDVWTHTPYRRQGVATTIMRRLLARLPGQHVYLFTDEAGEFYLKLGFKQHGMGMGLVVGKWLANE